MSELLMFIGLSIFMIVLFVLLVIGVILISPFVLLVIVISLIILAINKIKDIFSRKKE